MNKLEIESLQNQLTIARNEISNLRQQIKKLSTVHLKEVDNIKSLLENFQCQNCDKHAKSDELDLISANQTKSLLTTEISMKPIGVIKTIFAQKKGVPRQTSIGSEIRGQIILDPKLFTNAEHSLEGLDEFSHIWILYHFHKNTAHAKAKVSPPRLNGRKIGVFSCRSPHRPCPIGLSLVKIDKIEGSIIDFIGTDMVDDTPIFDIKPFIPQYDYPNVSNENISPIVDHQDFYNERQEPDGEEQIKGNKLIPSTSKSSTNGHIKVPNWVQTNTQLKVIFSEHALKQLEKLNMETKPINEILSSDPRSVYLKKNFKSEFYTFLISGLTVRSKFNDDCSSVTVLQVNKPDEILDLQLPK